MFGRGRRKARTMQTTEPQVTDAPEVLTEMAPQTVAPVDVSSSPIGPRDLELDVEFMAMMSQLDDSLAAMARACDRIEQAVAGASRHHPADAAASEAKASAAA